MMKKILKEEQMAHWAHGSNTEILWEEENTLMKSKISVNWNDREKEMF